MGRTACVDVPALALQLLVRRNPGWEEGAAAVVAEDRPQGLILLVNAAARRRRVLPGMRYAAGLSLAPDLRAGVVGADEVEDAIDAAVERLLRFTPGVEPAREEPGVFHLDASGLARLFPSPAAWARSIREDLASIGLRARMAVGFTRFGAYAAARTSRGLVVFARAEDERRALLAVPLDRLGVAPKLRDGLDRLGVRTVGDLVALPEEGLAKRFGEEARALHRLAAPGDGRWPGAASRPLAPRIVEPPPRVHAGFEFPERDATRLLFVVRRHLHDLLAALAARGEALTELAMTLRLDGAPETTERLRPAAPTLEAAQVLDLAHLRLASLRLPAGVTSMTLEVAGLRAGEEQLRLFAAKPRRDPAAAARAFARIVAEFGEGAVVTASLRDGHLPETAFAWEPLARLAPPRPRDAQDPPLVRRILETPRELAPRARHEPDGWMLGSLSDGRVIRSSGPYPVSTAWWTGAEVRREYLFAETAKGRLFWAFALPSRTRWLLQGEIE